MDSADSPTQPCYSARLLKPFLPVLRESALVPAASLEWLAALDPEARVHVASSHALLELARQVTNDELLGVKASAALSLGDGGAFDFILQSAATLRDALEAAGRFYRLLNDALDFALVLRGTQAVACFVSSVALPAAAEDLMICGLLHSQANSWPEEMSAGLEVWFRHGPPADLQAYRALLGTSRLHFDATLSGFGFPSAALALPLRTHDPRLHQLLSRYAEQTLAALPRAESTSQRVRVHLIAQLSTGRFGAEHAARSLHMSTRTMGRKLADEGTTFTELLDDVRRGIAMAAVSNETLGLSAVALLVGFAETSSFYRAFRRWTGTTPLLYRAKQLATTRLTDDS